MSWRLAFSAGLGALLLANPACADGKTDAAIRTIKSVPGDPAKLKTFCEMLATMSAAGTDPAKQAEADLKIGGLLKTLGPDISAAWNVGDEVDPETPDGKAFDAAVDEVNEKCPH